MDIVVALSPSPLFDMLDFYFLIKMKKKEMQDLLSLFTTVLLAKKLINFTILLTFSFK